MYMCAYSLFLSHFLSCLLLFARNLFVYAHTHIDCRMCLCTAFDYDDYIYLCSAGTRQTRTGDQLKWPRKNPKHKQRQQLFCCYLSRLLRFYFCCVVFFHFMHTYANGVFVRLLSFHFMVSLSILFSFFLLCLGSILCVSLIFLHEQPTCYRLGICPVIEAGKRTQIANFKYR